MEIKKSHEVLERFSDDEKKEFADIIIRNYYCRNFGSMSKSDFETLLFSEYYENRLSKKLPCDDYSISKELGITQARICALKERKQLRYPRKDIWQFDFLTSIKHAKYDEKSGKVHCYVEDVNVIIETRHKLECMGWYDECSPNRKLMVLSPKCFIDLCMDIQDTSIDFTENNRHICEECISKIKNLKTVQSVRHLLDNFNLPGLVQFLLEAEGEDIVMNVGNLLNKNLTSSFKTIWNKLANKKE